ncbi:MAG TPA: alpha-hydroxy acid oxidase, partial [Actinomycetota bacterium]|nr:alpha-hydroxy acid oxidase [Actinomycetota bacterium]
MSEPSALLTVDDYEKAAKRVLPKMAYDYYRSGAEEERTLSSNRKAFKRYEVWYRVLVDVSEVDTSTMVLGQRLAHPIIVAPTAYHRLAHPDGEIATAQGAEAAGALMVVSTLATTRLEDVAAATRGPKWFQLYIHKDRGLTKELVQRAQESGYAALVLTVDAPVLGRRIDDERNSFAL